MLACNSDTSADADADDSTGSNDEVDATTDADTTEGTTDPARVMLEGAIQKGPLIVGSSVQVSTLTESGSPTGDVFNTQTINDRGQFSLDAIPAGDIFIEGEGYYFNEVTGEVSSSQLTLRAYHRLDENNATVVLNLLTQLSSERIRVLLEEGAAFVDAVEQSEVELRETLGIGIPINELSPMVELDLMGEPELGNAYLLAVSAVFIEAAITLAGDQGSVEGELQQLVNTTTLDLADGELDASTRALFEAAETSLNPELVETNLAMRAMAVGLETPLPDLDTVLDQDHDDAANIADNCTLIPNLDQLDADIDGVGDVCDNCPDDENPTQSDADDNGLGDACDLPVVPVDPPQLAWSTSQVKQFDFAWTAFEGADFYRLLESADNGAPFLEVSNVVELSTSLTVPLHFRTNASYSLQACNGNGCVDLPVVDVSGSLSGGIGYFKSSNSEANDSFGKSIALSADGGTMVVGAPWESSSAAGIDGDQNDNSLELSGAVYVFVADGLGGWSQQAYIKASVPEDIGLFGSSVSLSADGNTLAVGTNQSNGVASQSGAAYVFVRDQGTWSEQALLKASNPDAEDLFASSLALSADGNTLAVGAKYEDSAATEVGGDQSDNSSADSGAAYVFARDGQGVWSQQAYIKAFNNDVDDQFGGSLALSGDGDTLAVGAERERSCATGVGAAAQAGSNGCWYSGAVYVYVRDAQDNWAHEEYIKATNTNTDDSFGSGVALSFDGSTLAVGAWGESSGSMNPADNSSPNAGAVYVYARNGGWSPQAYVKAADADANEWFGRAVVLSTDGNVLAIGAPMESSSAVGLEGDQADVSANFAGAAYVFTRDGGAWSQTTYLKASNTTASDSFGAALAISDDATTLVCGAVGEDSDATGIGGDQSNDFAINSGAVYVY